MRWLGLVAAFLIVATSPACIWDNDTLAQEAKGELDTLDAITGRFARYPALYYEQRLKIAEFRLREDPTDLAAYDNAATACDRLGRDDEAILWMRRKRKRLLRADSDALYRTEANEGTFWAHKWYAAGGRTEDLEWLRRGRDMIAKAIAINPDAHFGREKVQLAVMDWSLSEGELTLAKFLRHRSDLTPAEARRGLVGLVVLGSAWQSIDVIGAIGESGVNDGAIQAFVDLRLADLRKEGKKSLRGEHFFFEAKSITVHPENVAQNYRLLSKASTEFDANLKRFVNGQLAKGLHPDVDRVRFWEGYVPVPRPELIDLPLMDRIPLETQAAVVVLFVLVVGFGVRRFLRRR